MAICLKCGAEMGFYAADCPECGWAAGELAATEMKRGTCPKCGARDVYKGTEVFLKQGYRGTNTIPVCADKSIILKSAVLDNFVCTACGYLESYILDSQSLRDIESHWPKVRPPVQRDVSNDVELPTDPPEETP